MRNREEFEWVTGKLQDEKRDLEKASARRSRINYMIKESPMELVGWLSSSYHNASLARKIYSASRAEAGEALEEALQGDGRETLDLVAINKLEESEAFLMVLTTSPPMQLFVLGISSLEDLENLGKVAFTDRERASLLTARSFPAARISMPVNPPAYRFCTPPSRRTRVSRTQLHARP